MNYDCPHCKRSLRLMPVLNAEGGEVIAGEWQAFNRCPRCKGTMVSNLPRSAFAERWVFTALLLVNAFVGPWLSGGSHYYAWVAVWTALMIASAFMLFRRLRKLHGETISWKRWLPPSPNPAPDSHNITSPST